MKGDKKYILTLTMFCALALPVGYMAAQMYDDLSMERAAQVDREKYGDIYDLMLKMDGKVITLEKFKEPITVKLGQYFSENEKTQIVDAINALDEISPNINYNIIDSPNVSISADITILKADALVMPMAVATTSLNYSKQAKIVYPIYISLDEEFSDAFAGVDEKDNDLLCHVVKHEMMHTLGFADLYAEEEFDKSIMWYSTGNADVVRDYTQRDRESINKVYDDILVNIQHPKELYYAINSSTNIYKEQEDEELIY